MLVLEHIFGGSKKKPQKTRAMFKAEKSVTHKRGYNLRGYCIKAFFARFCMIMRNFALFCSPFWQEKNAKNAQKRTKRRNNV